MSWGLRNWNYFLMHHTNTNTDVTYMYLRRCVDQTNPRHANTPISNLPMPCILNLSCPPQTTQTYAHSQLPCWFSRTLHTHNKNHLIISTSVTAGFQPLVDTPCSPASMVVEEVIITPLPLTSGWASRGGREGKTFNQNAELLTKGPVNKCACNLIKSGRWCAEKGQDLIIWLMAFSRWGTQTGWGTSGESQLAGPLATQETQVDIWAHDLVPQGQHGSMCPAESPEEWNLSSGVKERTSYQCLQTNGEENEMSRIRHLWWFQQGPGNASLTFILLM